MIHHATVPWAHWNIELFLDMHATTASPHWLIATAIVLAKWPLYVALIFTIWQCWKHRDGRGALEIVCAWLVGNRIEAWIGAVAFHARPFAAGYGPAFMAHAADNSMPSSHAMTGVILILVLALRHRRWSSVLVAVLTVMMAWARVYVGVHWPADMVGALLVAGISVAAVYAVEHLAKRGRKRLESCSS